MSSTSTPTHHNAAPDIDTCHGKVPRHVAIIMDGNNRWARRQGLPSEDGHRAGEKALHAVIRRAGRAGISVVTVFAFSSENWRRPPSEVQHLMQLFMAALQHRVEELKSNRVRLRFIGDRSAFSADLQAGMQRAEAETADNYRMTLVVAVNYGGQWDMAQAARQLAMQVAEKTLDPSDIDDLRFSEQVCLSDLPPPDLLIRTGGEQRISNFLLWQLAYTELYFVPTLWPDFGAQALDQALADYAQRQRRFGRSGEDASLLQGE